jgi:hypothetical protein
MRHILLAATALALLSGAAHAQSSTSNSGSNSTAVNSSGSQSTSMSNPRVNVIGNPIGNGASSSNSGARASANTQSASHASAVGNTSSTKVGNTTTSTTINVNGYAGVDGSGNSTASSKSSVSGGSGSSGSVGDPSSLGSAGDPTTNLHYSGSYTVRNVPEVIPPNVTGGNPCAVGASGGLAVAGFGFSAGGTWADRACERRQQAALLFNMGEQKVALELMCQDDNIRSAMKIGGKPCTTDVAVAVAPAPVAQAPIAAPVAQAPVAAPVARVVSVAVAEPTKPARPEWCYTASPAEQRAHAVCDAKS